MILMGEELFHIPYYVKEDVKLRKSRKSQIPFPRP